MKGISSTLRPKKAPTPAIITIASMPDTQHKPTNTSTQLPPNAQSPVGAEVRCRFRSHCVFASFAALSLASLLALSLAVRALVSLSALSLVSLAVFSFSHVCSSGSTAEINSYAS